MVWCDGPHVNVFVFVGKETTLAVNYFLVAIKVK